MHLGSVGVSRNGGRTAKGWNIAICMLLASVLGLCLMLWITPPVHADDGAGLGITATDDITDTQNLLGSNVSEITDAINQTKRRPASPSVWCIWTVSTPRASRING